MEGLEVLLLLAEVCLEKDDKRISERCAIECGVNASLVLY